MTYAEATEYLFSLRRFGWRLGLETIQRLLELLGSPQQGLPSVHIGGTNGKGSTAAMLAAILQAAGHRTGLYTSPHLLDFSERIRVDGRPVGKDEVTHLTARLKALCASHFAHHWMPHPAPGAAPDLLPHPTFFELTTAMAFQHFRRLATEAVVIEVGLGGRFDATNVLTPQVSVVTNVSLEHQEYLGRTLPAIAREKAGIVKPGVPVVTATRGDAYDVVRQAAADRGAPVIPIHERYAWTVRESGLSGQTFDLAGPAGRYAGLRIPLAGRHQTENAVAAIAAAEVLEAQGFRLGEGAIRRGLERASWPGRLQIVSDRPRILLDGAHNPAGAEALAAFVAEHRSGLNRLILVFGVLRDKDWEAMLAPLGRLADQVILTHPPADRGADPRDLLAADRYCRKVEIATDIRDAIALARSVAQPEDTILVTGSLYTVAAALRALGIPVP
jgi:dihydrofolate synthase/folylpolyglutamate synthase